MRACGGCCSAGVAVSAGEKFAAADKKAELMSQFGAILRLG